MLIKTNEKKHSNKNINAGNQDSTIFKTIFYISGLCYGEEK